MTLDLQGDDLKQSVRDMCSQIAKQSTELAAAMGALVDNPNDQQAGQTAFRALAQIASTAETLNGVRLSLQGLDKAADEQHRRMMTNLEKQQKERN